MTRPVTGLYAHVPFCARKCSYCAFYSEPSDAQTMDRCVLCMEREILTLPDGFRPETIFFGGGTPSILNIAQWERILEALCRKGIVPAGEFTVECNPATVSLEKARLFRDMGVNRVSMGVQSLDPRMLERLGRIHSRDMVFDSFDIFRAAGFDNVNIDLMFAIPGQTMDVWRGTLREVMAMRPEHLSTYEVIYEEDTPLFEELRAGRISEDEDLACAMYDDLVEACAAVGLRRYEVSNFARDMAPLKPSLNDPDYACRHNLNYWRGGQFHGIGPSATSYVGGVRTKNVANTRIYCERIECGRLPVESSEELSPIRRAGETAAFGLRMAAGWPFHLFQEVTGFDLRKEWAGEMRELESRGWALREPDRFRLTADGLRFADAAAELFLR